MYTFLTTRMPYGDRFLKRVSEKFIGVAGKGITVFTLVLFLNLISFGQIAPVNAPAGGFHIDSDLRANTPTAGVGDWVPGSSGSGGHVFSLAGVPLDPAHSFLRDDIYSSNSDDVFSGSSMADNPNDWKWAYSSAPAKNEINRGMIHLAPDASGDIWIMAGADRLSTNGTAYIDFELLQGTLTRNSSTFKFNSAGPNGGRTIGDLLITVLYNNGGGVSSILYYRWQALSGGGFGYVAITPGLLGFAITNSNPVDVPFGAFGSTTYNKFQYVEAAVNLSQVVNYVTNDPCVRLSIQTIFIKTKASTSTTAALKDFIEPIQVNFTVGGVNIDPVGPQCLNGSPVTLSGVPPGGTFSGPGVSGNTFTPSVAGLGTHQIIYSKELTPGCIKRDTIYIQVITSIGGAVTGGTTVCSGTNSGTLTLSGHTGSVVKWQRSTDGVNWTDIANTSTTFTFSNLTVATRFRAVVQNAACDPANSTPAIVNVDAPSVGGTVSGGRAVCISGNSGSVTLSGHTGSVVKWQRSTDGVNWTDIANTTTTQSYSNLTVATRFRAVVQNGVCAPANSGEAIITVDPISEGGSLAGSTHVCGLSNSGTISLSGQVGNVLKWQQSTNNGSSFTDISGTAGLSSYTFNNLTQTTIFRAVVKSGVCDPANSTTATVTVDPATVPGSISGPAAVCDNASSTILTLSGYTGSILKWQMSSDGITWMDIANTTTTYDIGLITTKMYYRVQVKSGMCDAQFTPTITVMVIACGPTTNHCTYTQGFYGNEGGLGCSVDPTGTSPNSLETTKDKMLRAFTISGSNKVVFGRADIGGVATDDRAFTLFREDILNDNIFLMLPGGGTQYLLGLKPGGTAYGSTFEGATFADATTWNAVPIIPGGSNYGTIKNLLLAQTVTMFFNLNNGTNLGFVVLHDTLYVSDIDCISGNPIPGAMTMKFGLPHEVILYIAQNSSVYTNNVAGLYMLANDVLGGVQTPGLSPALVANAVDQINKAFDGCRALVGSFDLPLNSSILYAVPYQQMERSGTMAEANSGLLVETYPNPFREKVSFRIQPKESGIGTLDLYSSSGQKLRTVFRGYLSAGTTRIIDFNVPENMRGSLMYQFRLGGKRVSGKLIGLLR